MSDEFIEEETPEGNGENGFEEEFTEEAGGESRRPEEFGDDIVEEEIPDASDAGGGDEFVDEWAGEGDGAPADSGGFGDEYTRESYEEESYEGDSYVEESETSWTGRLGSAVKGVVIGFIIFLLGFPLLFWNEGRAVKRYRTLKEGAGACISVSADRVNPENEGNLVYVTGQAVTDEILSDTKPASGVSSGTESGMNFVSPRRIDPKNEGRIVTVAGMVTTSSVIPDTDFGIRQKAIKLQRTVKMLQWGEKKSGNTYTYVKGWAEKPIPSSRFKKPQGHTNPASIPYKNKKLATKKVTLGAFNLHPDVIRKINFTEPLRITELPKDLPAKLKGRVHLYKDGLYIGKDPMSPQIGDLKVEFGIVRTGEMTVTALQQGDMLVPIPESGGKDRTRVFRGLRKPGETAPASGIAVNAIKLKRTVEMYQWKETKETKTKSGDSGKKVTEYKYSKVWSESLISSGHFKKQEGYDNPDSKAVESRTVLAKNVQLGAFHLPQRFVQQFSSFTPVSVKEISSAIPKELRSRTKVVSNGFYVGGDPRKPQIGDLRITYGAVKPPQTVSLIAVQSENSFEPYKSKNGTIDEFRNSAMTADQIFKQEQSQNKILAWVLRVVGFFLMFIGLSMIFKPLSVAVDFIPILGNLAETGVGLVAFFIAGCCALFTVSVAWFFYRPFLSVILIAIAVGLIVFLKMRGGKTQPPPAPLRHRPKPPSAPPAPPQSKPGGTPPPPPPGG